jgi:hypothetical protein
MKAVLAAASMYPSAHPDCISAMALARWRAGQLSATRTAPADHSPPSPNPTIERQKTRLAKPVARADPPDPME